MRFKHPSVAVTAGHTPGSFSALAKGARPSVAAAVQTLGQSLAKLVASGRLRGIRHLSGSTALATATSVTGQEIRIKVELRRCASRVQDRAVVPRPNRTSTAVTGARSETAELAIPSYAAASIGGIWATRGAPGLVPRANVDALRSNAQIIDGTGVHVPRAAAAAAETRPTQVRAQSAMLFTAVPATRDKQLPLQAAVTTNANISRSSAPSAKRDEIDLSEEPDEGPSSTRPQLVSARKPGAFPQPGRTASIPNRIDTSGFSRYSENALHRFTEQAMGQKPSLLSAYGSALSARPAPLGSLSATDRTAGLDLPYQSSVSSPYGLQPTVSWPSAAARRLLSSAIDPRIGLLPMEPGAAQDAGGWSDIVGSAALRPHATLAPPASLLQSYAADMGMAHNTAQGYWAHRNAQSVNGAGALAPARTGMSRQHGAHSAVAAATMAAAAAAAARAVSATVAAQAAAAVVAAATSRAAAAAAASRGQLPASRLALMGASDDSAIDLTD